MSRTRNAPKDEVWLNWGGIDIVVAGESATVTFLKREFARYVVPNSGNRRAALAIEVSMPTTARPPQEVAGDLVLIGKTAISPNHVSFNSKAVCWKRERQEGSNTFASGFVPLSRKRTLSRFLPSVVQKLLNFRYVAVEELQAIDFLYGVFLPQFQLQAMQAGLSFVHASSFLDRSTDGAYLVCGWGGAGKTSLAAHVLLSDARRYEFLSDDLALLSSDGQVHCNPMGVHLYPYNVEQCPLLSRHLFREGTWGLNRFHWLLRRHMFGPAGVVRRVSPATLYGDSSRRVATLRRIYLVERYTGDQPVVEQAQPDDFAHGALNVTTFEFASLVEPMLARGMVGGPLSTPFPSLEEFTEALRRIYLRASERALVYRVRIPLRWGPDEAGGYFRSIVESPTPPPSHIAEL